MGDWDDSGTVQITGKIMVLGIIILFIVVVFVLFLHLYAKWFWWRIEDPTPPSPSRRNRRRFVFTPGQDQVRRGLELSVLRSLPMVIFQSKDFKDGLECAVCLSEVAEGEKTRLLPKCNHGFHVDCIDVWFQSHSTCPLCRNSVAPLSECFSVDANDLQENIQSPDEILASVLSTESPNFPTNVLFWGDQTQVSTGGGGAGGGLEEGTSTEGPSFSSPSSAASSARQDEMMVIDIPVQASDNFPEEESKSPMPAQRLRSLKRLLSREKRVAPSSSSSSVDV